MIFGARIEYEGPDGTYQVLDSGEGRQVVGPFTDDALRELDKSLNGFRLSELEKEAARLEREGQKAWRPSWREYQCPDPEGDWIEMLREQADLHRKAVRERGGEDKAA